MSEQKSSVDRVPVAVVTGAGEGIGAALVVELARHGFDVVLAGRTVSKLETVAAQCRAAGRQALVHATDVTLDDSCRALIEAAIARFGRIDVLVNNAGISMRQPVVETTDLGVYERLMRVNYHGPVACTTFALPYLKQSRGMLVAVSSLQGLFGFPTYAGYCATKHAVQGFFDSLRMELRATGVGVLVVAPGPVGTAITRNGIGAGVVSADATDEASGNKEMSAEHCARLIVRAIRRRKRRLIMTAGGRLAVALKPFAPGFVDAQVARKIDQFWEDT